MAKDYLVNETDGGFLKKMHEMEKQAMQEIGDKEGLAELEKMHEQENQMNDEEDEEQ